MSDKHASLLERYRPWRRQAQAGFWVLVLAAEMLFNSVTLWIDLNRGPRPVAFWQPLVWEITSALAIGLLIPALLAFDRRFPLRWGRLRRNAMRHLGGTVVFSVVHVLVMVLLRQLSYAAVGMHYEVPSWATMLVYEYLKDLRSYCLILTAFYSYRFVLLRLQGEARVLDAPEPPDGAAPAPDAAPAARPERFLVRKLRREFLIAAADIEWLQAQGNYVGLHVNGHDYLLRSTLSDFMAQLDPARFARVHRSYVINLDMVAEIEPLDAGDARLLMKGGTRVPCSRRYRDVLGAAR
jgi:DNA-binding LytR/AlgR family response regulator